MEPSSKLDRQAPVKDLIREPGESPGNLDGPRMRRINCKTVLFMAVIAQMFMENKFRSNFFEEGSVSDWLNAVSISKLVAEC